MRDGALLIEINDNIRITEEQTGTGKNFV